MFRSILLVLLFVGAFSLRSHAQFGVQVGGAINAMKVVQGGADVERGWRFAYNAGVLYRFRGRKFDVQPTLLYMPKGAIDNNSGTPYITGVSEIQKRLRYVQVAVPVIYRTSDGVRNYTYNLGLGPYLATLVGGQAVTVPLSKGDNVTTDLKTGFKDTDDVKPLDAGLTIYVTAKIRHISAGFSYDYGLYNVSPRPNETQRNRSFTLLANYMF